MPDTFIHVVLFNLRNHPEKEDFTNEAAEMSKNKPFSRSHDSSMLEITMSTLVLVYITKISFDIFMLPYTVI